MTTPTPDLAPHQIEFFNHNGFLTLDRITTDDEVGQLREVYDRLFGERIGWGEGSQFDLGGVDSDEPPKLPQIQHPSKYAPELRETTYLRNARAIAEQLFGDDLEDGNGEHMIYKPAVYGAVTPWHQDQAYHAPDKRYRNVNFWLPLDDTSIDSGCLQFVPGSHLRREVLPHHSIDHDPRVHGLEVDDAERYDDISVACPLPAGGCTLHASYMLHYAGANTSARPRRAYTLVFRARTEKLDVPVDNYWMREKQTARQERLRSAMA